MLKTYALALLVTLCLQTGAGAGQTARPQTVLDYYVLLPDKYFEADKEQRVKWMLDPGRGAVVDVKNGYIYAPGDGAQASLHVCLFRKADASYVIAVKLEMEGETSLDFYTYKNGGFADVTRSVLPAAVNKNFEYEMPRYGTTIKVKDKNGRGVYDLVWSGGRFVRRRS